MFAFTKLVFWRHEEAWPHCGKQNSWATKTIILSIKILNGWRTHFSSYFKGCTCITKLRNPDKKNVFNINFCSTKRPWESVYFISFYQLKYPKLYYCFITHYSNDFFLICIRYEFNSSLRIFNTKSTQQSLPNYHIKFSEFLHVLRYVKILYKYNRRFKKLIFFVKKTNNNNKNKRKGESLP